MVEKIGYAAVEGKIFLAKTEDEQQRLTAGGLAFQIDRSGAGDTIYGAGDFNIDGYAEIYELPNGNKVLGFHTRHGAIIKDVFVDFEDSLLEPKDNIILLEKRGTNVQIGGSFDKSGINAYTKTVDRDSKEWRNMYPMAPYDGTAFGQLATKAKFTSADETALKAGSTLMNTAAETIVGKIVTKIVERDPEMNYLQHFKNPDHGTVEDLDRIGGAMVAVFKAMTMGNYTNPHFLREVHIGALLHERSTHGRYIPLDVVASLMADVKGIVGEVMLDAYGSASPEYTAFMAGAGKFLDIAAMAYKASMDTEAGKIKDPKAP